MGTIGTFALGVTAFLATLATLFNPMYGALKALEGKRMSDFEQMIKNATADQWVSGCLRYGCFFVLALLLTFVLEPLFVVGALANKIGNPLLGYAALTIVGLGWFDAVRTWRNNKPKKSSVGAVVTPSGERVEGKVEIDEEIPRANWPKLYFRRVLFALPVLYLWYVFFVSIGVLK